MPIDIPRGFAIAVPATQALKRSAGFLEPKPQNLTSLGRGLGQVSQSLFAIGGEEQRKEDERRLALSTSEIQASSALAGAELENNTARREIEESDIQEYVKEQQRAIAEQSLTDAERAEFLQGLDLKADELRGAAMKHNRKITEAATLRNNVLAYDSSMARGDYAGAQAVRDTLAKTELATPEWLESTRFDLVKEPKMDRLIEELDTKGSDAAYKMADNYIRNPNISFEDGEKLRTEAYSIIKTRVQRETAARLERDRTDDLKGEKTKLQVKTRTISGDPMLTAGEIDLLYANGDFGDPDTVAAFKRFSESRMNFMQELGTADLWRNVIFYEENPIVADPNDKEHQSAIEREYRWRVKAGADPNAAATDIVSRTMLVPKSVEGTVRGQMRNEDTFAEAVKTYSAISGTTPGAKWANISNEDMAPLALAADYVRLGMDPEQAAHSAWNVTFNVSDRDKEERTAVWDSTMTEAFDDFEDTFEDALDAHPNLAEGFWEFEPTMKAQFKLDTIFAARQAYKATGDLESALFVGMSVSNKVYRNSTLNDRALDWQGDTIGREIVKTRIAEGMEKSVREILVSEKKDDLYRIDQTLQKVDPYQVEIYDPPEPIYRDGQRVFALRYKGQALLNEYGGVVLWHYLLGESATPEDVATREAELAALRLAKLSPQGRVAMTQHMQKLTDDIQENLRALEDPEAALKRQQSKKPERAVMRPWLK